MTKIRIERTLKVKVRNKIYKKNNKEYVYPHIQIQLDVPELKNYLGKTIKIKVTIEVLEEPVEEISFETVEFLIKEYFRRYFGSDVQLYMPVSVYSLYRLAVDLGVVTSVTDENKFLESVKNFVENSNGKYKIERLSNIKDKEELKKWVIYNVK